MVVRLTTYEPAEDLTSDAAVATFMAEAFATEDAGYIAHAFRVVARAKGMAQMPPLSLPQTQAFSGRGVMMCSSQRRR
jgi:DNA-binding phage protein